jgi:uncharacterized membrane-anchored protein
MLRSIAVTICCIISLQLFASNPSSMTNEEKVAEFLDLDWKGPGTYALQDSHAVLSVPGNHIALIGEDARRAGMLLLQPSAHAMEAVLHREESENLIFFGYYPHGYVSTDDWDVIDPQALIKAMKVHKAGAVQDVVGWIQEPKLDQQAHTVTLAVETEESVVTAIALKLGRLGFEKVVWVAPKDKYIAFTGALERALSTYRFDPGFRYEDYTAGDKVSRHGIALLVSETLGVPEDHRWPKMLRWLIGFITFSAIYVLYRQYKKRKAANP